MSREARNEKIKGTKRLREILVVCVSVLRCAFVCLRQVCAFVCVRGRGFCYFGGFRASAALDVREVCMWGASTPFNLPLWAQEFLPL